MDTTILATLAASENYVDVASIRGHCESKCCVGQVIEV